MSSGRSILKSIDRSLQTLGKQLGETDQRIQAGSDELIRLEQQQAESFRQLARLRLDSVVSGELDAELQITDARVSKLLAQREEELAELSAQVEAILAAQERMGRKRTDHAAEVDAAANQLDAREARTQNALLKQQSYTQQLEQARQAERVAEHAEEKYQEALENRREKGKPYEDDPLFSYLWGRAYGTRDYRANALTRYLDRWVARLCDYNDARPNYAMLLELPKRLQEHAERVRQAAEEQYRKLRDLEEAAAEEDGIPDLREVLGHSREELARVDEEIEALGEKRVKLLHRKAAFSSGEDSLYKQAIQALAELMENESLRVLYYRARATAGAEDDRLVEALSGNEERMEALQQSLQTYRRNHDRQIGKLQELEQVRGRFKRERYDDIHSSFANKALLMAVLSQFIQGVANSDELWETIRRERRYRRVKADPDFGSGGLRRGRSPWPGSFPGPGPRGGGGNWGGPPRGGGGGFRTGGGF